MDRLKSRKFWMAVVGGLIAFGNSMFGWGLSMEQVWSILTPLLGFMIVEGVTDTTRAMRE